MLFWVELIEIGSTRSRVYVPHLHLTKTFSIGTVLNLTRGEFEALPL